MHKELALTLLVVNPSSFVNLIAIYLLAFVAPRLKKDDFVREEETRIIISSPKPQYKALLNGITYPNQFQSMIDKVLHFVANEKQRADNGKFYREIFMPISVLKRVYVKKIEQKEKVEKILSERRYVHIPVDVIN